MCRHTVTLYIVCAHMCMYIYIYIANVQGGTTMLVCEYIMYICTYFCAGTDTHHMIHIEKSVSRTKPNLHLQNKRSYVV